MQEATQVALVAVADWLAAKLETTVRRVIFATYGEQQHRNYQVYLGKLPETHATFCSVDNGLSHFKTPLMKAVRQHDLASVALICESSLKSLDAVDKTRGWTALMYAVDSQHEDICKVLCANGADVRV